MRSYTNDAASGTMMQSQRGKEPIDNVIDRVMMIGQRLVKAEDYLKAAREVINTQAKQIELLSGKIEDLENKIENIALKASGKEFKKPTTTRKPAAKKTETVEVTKETE